MTAGPLIWMPSSAADMNAARPRGRSSTVPSEASSRAEPSTVRTSYPISHDYDLWLRVVQLQRILVTQGINSVPDIGANIGQYGSGLRSGGFEGRIVSWGPQSLAYGRLASRMASDPRWEAVPMAAGAQDSKLTINIAGNSYSSSFLPPAALQLEITPASRVMKTEEVSVTTVDALIERCGLTPSRLLLKIEAQGYEQFVLDGARTTLGSLAAVQLELSFAVLYEGQQLSRRCSIVSASWVSPCMHSIPVSFIPVRGSFSGVTASSCVPVDGDRPPRVDW